MERQPEIEIYLRDCPSERLLSWLDSKIGQLGQAEEAGAAAIYQTTSGAIVVTPNVEDGPFVGVWFNLPDTPWRSDVECARQAARELGCVVRCCPGREFPAVPAWAQDVFLEIAEATERPVNWT